MNRVDRTRELDQRAIAHELENAPLVRGDKRLELILAASLQCRERASLILFDEATEPDDVGGQDGGKSAIQGGSPLDQSLAEGRHPIHDGTGAAAERVNSPAVRPDIALHPAG